MHLVFHFCGTGNPHLEFGDHYDYVNNQFIKTIFVNGCDTPEVCNSALFPDLKNYAKRLVEGLFNKNENKSQLKTTNKEILKALGVNVSPIYYDEEGISHHRFASTLKSGNEDNPIESITLCGYSRGAVTCFEVARALNKIVPHIPVDIVADQPVPGNCYQGPGTNANSIADCSDLTNIKNVTVILGAYTGAKMTTFDLHVKLNLPDSKELKKHYKNSYISIDPQLYYVNEEGIATKVEVPDEGYNIRHNYPPHLEKTYKLDFSWLELIDKNYKPEVIQEDISQIHRGFFSQIIPKLPRTAKQEHILIPRESHHQNRPNAPTGQEHMHMQVAKFLNQKSKELVSDEALEIKIEGARFTYKKVDAPPTFFPQISQLQSFFGLKKEEAYRYLDKLHPYPNLRKGMLWQQGITLSDWWAKHDKKTLRSTQQTKDLVKRIKITPNDNPEALKALYVETEKWLIDKENSSTSRYYQVESLRDNIYHYLINKFGVEKASLDALNGNTLHENNYFLKHWQRGSAAASWFQTKETDSLDVAFKKHAITSLYTKEDDEHLISALDEWLKVKQNSRTHRYNLVIEMREHLQKIVDDCYKQDIKKQMTI
jgi:hypothetical protein